MPYQAPAPSKVTEIDADGGCFRNDNGTSEEPRNREVLYQGTTGRSGLQS